VVVSLGAIKRASYYSLLPAVVDTHFASTFLQWNEHVVQPVGDPVVLTASEFSPRGGHRGCQSMPVRGIVALIASTSVELEYCAGRGANGGIDPAAPRLLLLAYAQKRACFGPRFTLKR
jgi:hypothetical protein